MHDLENRLCVSWPPTNWSDITVLVAVSGGPDSVALLRAMVAVRARGEGRIVMGHFHHGLRGTAADADADFVAALGRDLHLRCVIGRADEEGAATSGTGSLEEACRKARYRFLRKTAESVGARYIVTAHTSDDQVETILHHILRGTGLRGLGGMRRSRAVSLGVSIIRPFLCFARREILEYLDAVHQPYREDTTNKDVALTRNRLRHELIPLLVKNYNPAVADAVLRLGRTAREAQEALVPAVRDVIERCVQRKGGQSVTVNCGPLADQSRHLVRELFVAIWDREGWPQQAMSFVKWDELAEMAMAEPPAGKIEQRALPGGITARRSGPELQLSPPDLGTRS
jgi:tRNA(Ile)-lysidine synthase